MYKKSWALKLSTPTIFCVTKDTHNGIMKSCVTARSRRKYAIVPKDKLQKNIIFADDNFICEDFGEKCGGHEEHEEYNKYED